MAVGPYRLDGITPYAKKLHQLERFYSQRLGRIFVKVAHDVHFALATGARTRAAQIFEQYKIFTTAIPFNGQFIPNLLDVQGFHQRFFNSRSKAASVSGLT